LRRLPLPLRRRAAGRPRPRFLPALRWGHRPRPGPARRPLPLLLPRARRPRALRPARHLARRRKPHGGRFSVPRPPARPAPPAPAGRGAPAARAPAAAGVPPPRTPPPPPPPPTQRVSPPQPPPLAPATPAARPAGPVRTVVRVAPQADEGRAAAAGPDARA